MLHQNEPCELVGIEIVVEHTNHVLVVNLVKQFDFPHKAGKEFLAMGFRVRNVLLADELFINLRVVQLNSFAASALSQFLQ
jgi:hypothetical protein